MPRQASMELSGTQTRIAQKVWGDASQTLSQLEFERTAILSRVDAAGQQAAFPQTATRTCQLLQQVAELSENAQLQLEVARNASRKFVWQVCSPDNLARLCCFYWPVFPDLMHCLRAAGTT